MNTRNPIPEPQWPPIHAYGAVLGQEYEVIFQLLKGQQPFVHTIHNENTENLKQAADYFGRAHEVRRLNDEFSHMEGFQ